MITGRFVVRLAAAGALACASAPLSANFPGTVVFLQSVGRGGGVAGGVKRGLGAQCKGIGEERGFDEVRSC